MRKPTPREVSWEHWRRRIAGEVLPIHPDEPQPGFYRSKRRGQHVGVQIDWIGETDADTGELLSDEILAAFIGEDQFLRHADVCTIWTRCGGSPITAEEFERLLAMPAVSDLTRSIIT